MNTKAKIIIYSLLGVSVVSSSIVIFRAVKKRKVLDRIYKKLNDNTSVEGISANLESDEILKASLALNPNFWKNGSGSIKPNTNYMIQDKQAREIASEINKNMGVFNDDEAKIIAQFKRLKSQGAVSQVAYQYQNSLKFGDLSNDLENSLPEWGKDRVKELYNYLNTLPY